jgi:hypothetical protein
MKETRVRSPFSSDMAGYIVKVIARLLISDELIKKKVQDFPGHTVPASKAFEIRLWPLELSPPPAHKSSLHSILSDISTGTLQLRKQPPTTIPTNKKQHQYAHLKQIPSHHALEDPRRPPGQEPRTGR